MRVKRQRLFVNLLDNAIKYTERGRIIITAQKNENEITINVTDTGIGIPPEHLHHIFDRFYRVEESRVTREAGLGLSIAQEIVHAHNGRIEAHTVMKEGSVFTISLLRKI